MKAPEGSARKLPPRVSAFLAAIREMPSVSRASAAAGIQRGLHYRRLKDDAAYRKAFEAAWEIGVQSLEDEAVRRAHEGITEPVMYQGQPCYPVHPKTGKKGKRPIVIRRFSDGLMQFLLRGARPEKYREIKEHTGPGGGPLEAKIEVEFIRPK